MGVKRWLASQFMHSAYIRIKRHHQHHHQWYLLQMITTHTDLTIPSSLIIRLIWSQYYSYMNNMFALGFSQDTIDTKRVRKKWGSSPSSLAIRPTLRIHWRQPLRQGGWSKSIKYVHVKQYLNTDTMIQVCIHMYLDVFAYYFDFFLDVNSCALHIVSDIKV